jgi:hypothetical protein
LVTDVQVQVRGYAAEPATAVVRLDPLVPGRRIGRAVTGFAALFAIALVSALIPVAHFLLVPGFLIAAFVTLAVRLGVTTLVLSAHGKCPDCGLEQDFDLAKSWRLPQDTACRGCHRRLTLTAEPTSQG